MLCCRFTKQNLFSIIRFFFVVFKIILFRDFYFEKRRAFEIIFTPHYNTRQSIKTDLVFRKKL